MKAYILDDEHSAIINIDLIVKEFCKNVEIIGSNTSPIIAMQEIQQLQPQLVFLDIEMPEMTGFEFLKNIPSRNFEIIFVTAYNQFAIDAFRVNAIDYLLKPVNIIDLVQAVTKVESLLTVKQNSHDKINNLLSQLTTPKIKKVAISNMDGIEYIAENDIILVEGEGSYTKFILNGRSIMTSKNLKEVGAMLSPLIFYRVHNSYIVNLNHVKKFSVKDQSIEMSNGQAIPISRKIKEEFLIALNNHHK